MYEYTVFILNMQLQSSLTWDQLRFTYISVCCTRWVCVPRLSMFLRFTSVSLRHSAMRHCDTISESLPGVGCFRIRVAKGQLMVVLKPSGWVLVYTDSCAYVQVLLCFLHPHIYPTAGISPLLVCVGNVLEVPGTGRWRRHD